MIRSLIAKWKERAIYKTFTEMPDWLIVFFAVSGFIIAGFYGYILGQITPEYLEIANKTPLSQWGWQGWSVTTILAFLSYIVWHFGSISLRCNGILRDRWFK